MNETGPSTWEIVWQSVVVPLGLGVFALFRYVMNRRDQAAGRKIELRRQADMEMQSERTRLSADMADFVDRLEREILRLSAQMTVVERDLEHERSIRRQIEIAAIEYRHAAANAQQLVNSMERQAKQDVTKFAPLLPPMSLPQQISPPGILPEDPS